MRCCNRLPVTLSEWDCSLNLTQSTGSARLGNGSVQSVVRLSSLLNGIRPDFASESSKAFGSLVQVVNSGDELNFLINTHVILFSSDAAEASWPLQQLCAVPVLLVIHITCNTPENLETGFRCHQHLHISDLLPLHPSFITRADHTTQNRRLAIIAHQQQWSK